MRKPIHHYLNKKINTLLIILLLIAAFLRFYNLNWDQGNFFHPDERNIANAVAKIHFFDQLNPGFFAYGGFSIYLYRAAGDLMVFITHNPIWVMDFGHINVIGRFFSALFSTLTIIPVYFLAKKIKDKHTAILSCALYTFTVSSIQMAHFGVTESLFTLTGVTICLASINIILHPRLRQYLLTGVLLGTAAATKTTEILFGIFLATAHIAGLLQHRRTHLFRKQLWLVLCIIIAFATFTFFSPYTFLSWNKFLESMHYESGVATGSLPVVYTYQFNHTIPYLFQIQNFFWQMGPAALFALIGFGFLFWYMVKTRNLKLAVFFSFPIVYFLYVGSWHTKFIRYMVPLLPFLIISASYLLVLLQETWERVGRTITASVVIITILWGFAFFHIYTQEQTRVTASRWIYTHIPPGSKIYGEHWDDGLPIPLNTFNLSIYTLEQLTIYEPDNVYKLNYYPQKLSSGDYIVINTRRLYVTLMQLTKDYPLTSKYYKLLFAGKLGYQKIEEFTSYPTIFGIQINDDASEETFQVYEHPKVLIFKNTGRYNEQLLRNILKQS